MPTAESDDDQERRGEPCFLVKGAVLAHRVACPLAAGLDEDRQSLRVRRDCIEIPLPRSPRGPHQTYLLELEHSPHPAGLKTPWISLMAATTASSFQAAGSACIERAPRRSTECDPPAAD